MKLNYNFPPISNTNRVLPLAPYYYPLPRHSGRNIQFWSTNKPQKVQELNRPEHIKCFKEQLNKTVL